MSRCPLYALFRNLHLTQVTNPRREWLTTNRWPAIRQYRNRIGRKAMSVLSPSTN